ncbi:MAG: hypothetical protein V9G10_13675 [Candidatus Nanopelagicales bacterium]
MRGEILALLLSLRESLRLSLLVVTHDLGVAWNIADRIAVMYLGRIVEQGPTEQVLSAPKHPYTQALLSVVPEIDRDRSDRAHWRAARTPLRFRRAAASIRAALRYGMGRRRPWPGIAAAPRSRCSRGRVATRRRAG